MIPSRTPGRRARRRQRLALLRGERGVEDQLGHAEDRVHRRADLVAHVGEELALGAIRRLRGLARAHQVLVLLPELAGLELDLGEERLHAPLLLAEKLELAGELLPLPVELEEGLGLVAQDHRLDRLVEEVDRAGLVAAEVAHPLVRPRR